MPKLRKLNRFAAAFALLAVTAASSFGQATQTEVEVIQEMFGLEKKMVVAKFMQLSEEDEGFWNVYNEYEAERRTLGTERIKIIQDYAQNYADISEEKIMELYKRVAALRKSTAKLQKTYFKRMKKEVGVSKAAQFWQIENYFNSMIQAEIYSKIPFIGENLEGK